MTQTQQSALYILRCALSPDNADTQDHRIDTDVYNVFNEHAVVPFVSDVIRNMPDVDPDIAKKAKEAVYSNVYRYSHLTKEQKRILADFKEKRIPVAVLKGTSAAQYYRNPYFRTMGDIDLLVKPEDYDRAVDSLLKIGYSEATDESEEERGRHRSFRFMDVTVELHHYFSLFEGEERANALNSMLFSAMSVDESVLPQDENGIVLLSHIRQHLEKGLGLRQIIDWTLFVASYLNDETWHASFREKAQATGLETLAVTVTKMCRMYLGLPSENRTFCDAADDTICERLMQYVMDCGNFGRTRDIMHSESVSALPSPKHPIQLFRYVQSHGEQCWATLKKHPWLRPFAWIYQCCRYVKMAVHNGVGAKKLKGIYEEGQQRNEMFDALGIKRSHE